MKIVDNLVFRQMRGFFQQASVLLQYHDPGLCHVVLVVIEF